MAVCDVQRPGVIVRMANGVLVRVSGVFEEFKDVFAVLLGFLFLLVQSQR